MNTRSCEQWVDIENYEGYYAVSNYGRIKSLQRLVPHGNDYQVINERILKLKIIKTGYVHIAMNKNGIRKTKAVHRLVARAFLSDWDKNLQVNHIDGDKTNNNVNNLEMCNSSENMKHAYRLGLEKSMAGENNVCAKLTNAQANEIRKLHSSSKITLVKLASMYNVSPITIKRIITGKRYFK